MLSKKVTHKRLRDKPSSKNKKTITQEDKDYLEFQKENSDLVCFICGKQNGIEIHHIKECSSDKKNHRHILPLCGVECHRLGTELSVHGTPIKFRAKYSKEEQVEYADRLYERYLDMMCLS